jgi:hypothetical protein
VRPLRRFGRARDNLGLCRDFINLRDARTVRLRDLAAGDRRDPVLFAVLARNRRPPALPDLDKDFFTGCRLSVLFETAVARLTAFRTGRPSATAFPTRAPITPPTTAPVGPAMLPIAAPVTAPAVCFGIGGTWISSNDGGLFSFSWSGINADSSRSSIRYKDISDDKVDIAVTKLKCPVALIRNRQLTSSSRSTVGFSSTLTMKRWPSRCLSATKILRSWQLQRQGQLLEQAEQFEHDYDNDNYSDYVEDVSVHAED